MERKAIPAKEKIIFALDFPSPGEAMDWVERLDGLISFYKVGLQLFLAGGWHIVDAILAKGNRVMLDLKFFDIPATVAKAVTALNGRGITFATVHGYEAMLRAAAEAAEDVGILAVTVLTSMNQNDLGSLGIEDTVEELVLKRARQAVEAGCTGVVASAREAAMLRQELGSDFTIVTPGIRPASDERNDQKRIATPGQAVHNGADYLVIGRPISTSADPHQTVEAICREMEAAMTPPS